MSTLNEARAAAADADRVRAEVAALAALRPGDWVRLEVRGIVRNASWYTSGYKRVSRVSGKTIWAGLGPNGPMRWPRSAGYARDTGRAIGGRGRIVPVPASEANAWRAGRIAEREALEAYTNREDVRIAGRLASMDTDSWLSLGVDRLRAIAAELDNARAGADGQC